jgi:hypothetical protein
MSDLHMSTIAEFVRSHYQWSQRDDGTRYWASKTQGIDTDEGLPGLLARFAMECHNGQMPNDERYQMMIDVLDIIAELPKDYDMKDSSDLLQQLDGIVPVMNYALIEWLGSHLYRIAYVDDYMSDFGADNVMDAIRGGYYQELEEVWFEVVRFLDLHQDEWTYHLIDTLEV